MGMEFNAYQVGAKTTAIYPKESAVEYLTLGLASEAGEVADKVKKHIRDSDGDYTDSVFRSAISKEIGDVLWYAAVLAWELGIDLNDIAKQNIDKLFDRYDRNVIRGSGDER